MTRLLYALVTVAAFALATITLLALANPARAVPLPPHRPEILLNCEDSELGPAYAPACIADVQACMAKGRSEKYCIAKEFDFCESSFEGCP